MNIYLGFKIEIEIENNKRSTKFADTKTSSIDSLNSYLQLFTYRVKL